MKRYERIPAASSIQTRNQTIRALLESAIHFSYNASKVVNDSNTHSTVMCSTIAQYQDMFLTQHITKRMSH